MTNKEFYGDDLLAIALSFGCQKLNRLIYGKECNGRGCDDCAFNRLEDIKKWLNAEHEEPELPLLENGDGLKPGDWIMVRDSDADSWEKRQFLFYYNNMFYCASKGECVGRYVGVMDWQQARLLEEGE